MIQLMIPSAGTVWRSGREHGHSLAAQSRAGHLENRCRGGVALGEMWGAEDAQLDMHLWRDHASRAGAVPGAVRGLYEGCQQEQGGQMTSVFGSALTSTGTVHLVWWQCYEAGEGSEKSHESACAWRTGLAVKGTRGWAYPRERRRAVTSSSAGRMHENWGLLPQQTSTCQEPGLEAAARPSQRRARLAVPLRTHSPWLGTATRGLGQRQEVVQGVSHRRSDERSPAASAPCS